ncbi:MAG: prepilin-type N-terminal cleavage/methylation domain-containing protein [Candidatus Omnitrophota bacterium]
MLKKNKSGIGGAAFSLLEVIVAMVILGISVTGFIAVHLNYKYNISKLHYYFVAVNLAREIEEYFESIRLTRDWSMAYYYADSGICYSGAGPSTYTCSGYALRQASIPPATETWREGSTEYTRRNRPDQTPFDVLGDIKVKNLVPKGAPNSVRIDCTATYSSTYGSYVVTTKIIWQDLTPQGQLRDYSETLSLIPLTPVNNQILSEMEPLGW